MKPCCVCGQPFTGAAFSRVACDPCRPVYRTCFTSVDEAIKHSVPTLNALDVERCLKHERAHTNRRALISALERRARRLAKQMNATPVAEPAPTLGAVQTSDRGFGRIEFQDTYGIPCGLIASSAATMEAVWLGGRGDLFAMHLDRQRVAALVHHLQCWLDHRTFERGGAE